MAKKRGRPKLGRGRGRSVLLQVRLSAAEKKSFADAASLLGQDLSVWVRDQLRRSARATLEEHGQRPAFLPSPGETDTR